MYVFHVEKMNLTRDHLEVSENSNQNTLVMLHLRVLTELENLLIIHHLFLKCLCTVLQKRQ